MTDPLTPAQRVHPDSQEGRSARGGPARAHGRDRRAADGWLRRRRAQPTDPYDALTLELERADSLTGLLAERLSALNERPDAPSERYALSLVAESVLHELQLMLEKARALHVGQRKKGKGA